MRSLLVPAALALTTLLPIACASFEGSGDPEPGPVVTAPDGGSSVDANVDDTSTDAAAPRASTIYVFGGATIVGQYEQPIFEAYAASILEDGSLGGWERAPALDVGRSYMASVVSPDGLVLFAGGNGMNLGGAPSDDHIFFRDDVAMSRGVLPEAWRAAPSLGAGSGRYAAAATFASGTAYLTGGLLSGDVPTDTIMAAPVTAAPSPSVQGWKQAGRLPFPMAHHGLVTLGSRLYAIGGDGSRDGGTSTLAETYMAPLDAGGTIGSWTATGKLPKALAGAAVVGIVSRVLVIGGLNGPNVSSSVFVGTQTSTQDLTWQESTPLQRERHHACVVRANGRVYVLGGATNAGYESTVEVGDVSGTSITWKEGAPMPVGRIAFGCFAR